MRTNRFIHAEGRRLVDGEGKEFQIRGVNLGNWFVPEVYISLANVGSFETGVYTTERALRAMQANRKLTEQQIEELYRLYMDT